MWLKECAYHAIEKIGTNWQKLPHKMGKDHNDNKKASQIVMTLILNSQQKLGYEKICGLGECPDIQTHSHKVWENVRKWVLNIPKWNYFGSCTLVKVWNLWNKSVNNKHGSKRTPNILLKSLEIKILKLRSHSSFGAMN
jgi:hypothetical protein